MSAQVKSFQEITPEMQASAGGKGGMLARLFQDGYPVPAGFVIFPAAFQDEALSPDAWNDVQDGVQTLRQKYGAVKLAVRSSALSEDSAQTSFAGEFETVLDVASDSQLLSAIQTVYASRQSARVQAYSAAHQLDQTHIMAVIVQCMIPAELSGVLFTADPVTGSYTSMIGNFVYGLGEQLVSGEANAIAFELLRPKGEYKGPDALQPFAAKLYEYARKLENELDVAQDIEWCVAQGKLYLLQARPITTLTAGNLDTYEINESLAEDTLWVNTNVAEAVPDVFSPFTWSIIRGFDRELNFIPGYYVWSGNIYGRVYSNIGRRISVIAALTGWDTKRILGLLGDLFGQAPDDMQVPLRPFSRSEVIRDVLPGIWRVITNMVKTNFTLKRFLRENPEYCQEISITIANIQTKADLLALWRDTLHPYTNKAWWCHTTGGSGVLKMMTLERKLTNLVGKEDANTLLSNLRGSGGLDSLGPVVGIAAVRKGEMSREEYLKRYGHRGPHEFELSIPHPAEDTHWLDQQLQEFAVADIDVDELLRRQEGQFEAAKKRFKERYPRKHRWLERQLAAVAKGAHRREAARSEFTRAFRTIRAFALKAGVLTGSGEDIFMLYVDEVEALLAGEDTAVKHIPMRKTNYEKYKALPPFPSVIRGRFHPEAWLNDPNRRYDYFDATRPPPPVSEDRLTGIPGASGRVEGVVRVLSTPEEGASLQAGEILVAATTNVGWTPLFPRAAAIITDIGAPLSHAAIVARELGIPAVVGCGHATARLKTGDRVIVDGGQGTVEILKGSSAS